ncbi:MAG: two-component regulator propeller domain-containing protein [Anaerolineales bacterium]
MSRFFRGILLCLALVVSCLSPLQVVKAQSSNIRFNRLTTTDGLPHDIVQCVLQDHDGYLWFGTQRGLSRYDGYTFTNFHHHRTDSNSLVNDTINVLFEDSWGWLWIGTVSGLDHFDATRQNIIHHPDVYESIKSIIEDSEGNIWIGTAGSGLFRFDRSSNTFVNFVHDPTNPFSLSDNHINSLFLDSSYILWIGTEYGGLNALDIQQMRFKAFRNLSVDNLFLDRVTTILPSGEDKLWIGTGNYHEKETGGLALFDPQQEKIIQFYEPLRHRHITTLLWDETYFILWIGSEEGLYRFNPASGLLEGYQNDPLNPFSLSANNITGLAQDRSGNLWITTYGGGVNHYARARLRFTLYTPTGRDSSKQNTAPVGTLLKDRQGIIWVGLHDNGLVRFDRNKNQSTYFYHVSDDPFSLSHDHVTALYEDRRGNLWVGTQEGLDRLDRLTGRFEHYVHKPEDPHSIAPGAVKVIIEDSRGFLWIGTEEPGTLSRYDPVSETFLRYVHNEHEDQSLPATYGIRAIVEDHEGKLWLGTYNGLIRFDPQKESFSQYRHNSLEPDSLSHDFVWALYEDPEGYLWIGTHVGLDRLSWPCGLAEGCEPIFEVYTTENGLPDDSIVSILGDKHQRLWLATMGGGLAAFDPSKGKVRSYTAEDGLQGNAFIIGAAYHSPDGEMLFGGLNGFNTFYPDQIHDNPLPPNIVLTAFRKFDQVKNFEEGLNNVKEIRLSYKENFFAFEFAALDFTAPERNQYAYKLEGFDNDWVYCGTRRYASYTNLSPGEYVFRVKGSNNDGIWNEQGVSVRVVVTPPFWGTLWFQVLVVLIVAGVAYSVIRERLRYIDTLRRSEERFRTLFENVPLGVCEADFAQFPPVLKHANPHWFSLFGWTIRRSDEPMLERCLSVSTLEHCRSRLFEQKTIVLETSGFRYDGNTFPLRLSVTVGAEKDLRRCILVAEDVTAEKARRSEEEAIAEERRRIAREIHDGLAQDMAALRLQVRRWQDLIVHNPDQVRDELEGAHQLLSEKIREVRRAIFALRPPAIDELGFWCALRRFLGEFAEQNQLHIHLQVNGKEQDLPSHLEPSVFRILQEALNNIARHARAQIVRVEVDIAESIRVRVKDDGIGFDPATLPELAKQGHLGLLQMRERVENLGGTWEIEAHPGQGTEIRVELVVKNMA